MPPKPRMIPRKSVQSVEPEQAKNAVSSNRMLPPPSPKTSHVILQSELDTLEASYREIAIAAGKLFQFYSYSRKERIATYSPYPPASTARMLGRSLEKYDQICDTIETRLQHSIAIIQRDVKALKTRLKAEEEEAAQRKPISSSTTPALLGSPIGQSSILTDSALSNVLPPVLSMQNRRQSAILSSLHRPAFPLKLDLSSLSSHTDPSFVTPVDVSVDLGLTRAPSPVTLAPKTAKALANEPTLDLFMNSSHQSIPELSMGSDNTASSKLDVPLPDKDVIDLTSDSVPRTQLGDSADKPIELDMDTSYDGMDLFGDRTTIPRDATSVETIQDNNPINTIPIPQNIDENLDKLLLGGSSQNSSLKNSSMSLHGEPPTSHSGNDSSADAFRLLEETRRFNLTSVDFSALTGLFNAGNGASVPQTNAPSDLDIMSQLLEMEGSNRSS